ncbi:hypothetical protein ABIA94_009431 [Bradyrhizobium sp. LA7.1]
MAGLLARRRRVGGTVRLSTDAAKRTTLLPAIGAPEFGTYGRSCSGRFDWMSVCGPLTDLVQCPLLRRGWEISGHRGFMSARPKAAPSAGLGGAETPGPPRPTGSSLAPVDILRPGLIAVAPNGRWRLHWRVHTMMIPIGASRLGAHPPDTHSDQSSGPARTSDLDVNRLLRNHRGTMLFTAARTPL